MIEESPTSIVFAHSILDGIDLGIVTADAAGDVTFVNRTAKTLLNVPDLPRGTRGPVAKLLGLAQGPEELLGELESQTVAYPLSTPTGELDLELSVSRAETILHDKIGYFFIFRDMREEKLRQLERARLERLAAIGTMVAGFAHEVRNPVAALRSLAESLGEELGGSEIAVSHVTRMLQVLDRIERLVKTSLQFGRPSAPQRDRVRPWSILRSAIAALEPRTRGHGEIRIEVQPGLPFVHVDESQLVQVLVILLNNALDSVTNPGRVLARVSRASDLPPFVRFEVHDDGPGIAADSLSRIFDPFFTTKASGTGLGLSIAQQIVSENGGTIAVSSQRGATTFIVQFPSQVSPSGVFREGSRMP